MDRREALRNVALLMGGAVSATTLAVLAPGCKAPAKKDGELFTREQQASITELADTIIPDTSSPGAKAAGVGPFIVMMMQECYPENVQKIFTNGLDDLEKRTDKKFSNSFVDVSPEQRRAILQEVVDELKQKKEKEKENAKPGGGRTGQQAPGKKDPEFFQLAKELTMLGYFTSEIGAKQAVVYVPNPGKYEPCVDLRPGQKAWAL